MALNLLKSPGVSISERDLSQYTEAATGTAVLVVGFAAKGRDYEPMQLTSRSAWLTQYGEPTNEAERYFFNASMEVINQSGILYCCKLPYKNDALDKVTVKTYRIDNNLSSISTVADYVKANDMADVMAGNYTAFGKLSTTGDYLSNFLAIDNTYKSFRLFRKTMDTFTFGIPYQYVSDEFLGSFAVLSDNDDNWPDVPVRIIYSKLSALFTKDSDFYKGLLSCGNPYLQSAEVNLSAITAGLALPDQTSAQVLISTYFNLYAAACGNNTKTDLFWNACDPSFDGTNLTNVENRFPAFATSKIKQFYKDNEQIFTEIAMMDPIEADEAFNMQQPYFYCDDEKFNLGAYYKAIALYGDTVEAQEAIESMKMVDVYNALVDFVKYVKLTLDIDDDSALLSDLTTAMKRVTGDGDIQYWTGSEKNLRKKLVECKQDLSAPVSDIVDALTALFKTAEYQKLRNRALEGQYYDSEFTQTAVDFYLENTIVESEPRVRLKKAKSLNVFYHVSDNVLSSKSYFDTYNGEDSASPELSSVEAVVEGAIETLSRNAFFAYLEEFTKSTDYEMLSGIAYDPNEGSKYLQDIIEAFKVDNAKKNLHFAEIRRADPTISSYMVIDSDPEVKLMDVETIDGYATGETPVTQDTIVIVDKTRGTLGTAFAKDSAGWQKQVVGIIPVITTAANGLYAQALLETGDTGIDDYNCVGTAKTLKADGFTTTYPQFEIEDKDAALPWSTDNASDYTVSRYVGGTFPSMHFTDDGTFDRQEMKKIGIVVLKAYLDPGEGNKVNYDIVESFVGELDKNATDPNTGATTFIDTLVNANSEYIEVYSNCFNTPGPKAAYSKMDMFAITNQKAGDLGFYQGMVVKDISLTESITKPLQLIWEKNESIDEKQLDIVVDAGVSNIAQFIKSVFGTGRGEYDPNSEYGTLFKLRSKEDTKTWRDIIGMYDDFCKRIRKDCMFVADGPRPFCLQGNKKIVRTSKPKNTIDGNILPMLKYITGLNTNYGAGYCDWFQIADEFSGDYFWCPPSIKAMGVYLNTDINFDYWMAPAGLNRGVVPALDVAFSPTQRQADEIYPKSWNYARSYPIEGIVLEGQRTFQSKASSLDRVAARRALLRFERICYQLARWFLYETNDVLTRQRFYDALNGAYAEIKARGGMYDYKIICDETVNTNDVIEANQFRCKIGVKLNKFMEFIMCEFVILKRSASWNEIL